LKAAIKFNIKQRRIESGNVLVGTGNVVQSQEAGIKLEINRERLAFQDWIGHASSLASVKDTESKTGEGYSLREIKYTASMGCGKKQIWVLLIWC